MKKKDIYEVAIKIVGIVAICLFIESLIACIYVFISFSLIPTNIKLNFAEAFQTNYCIFYIMSIVLYSIVGFLFLLRTDKILRLLKLTESSEVTLQIEKKTIYHITVLLIGFFMFAYSGDKLASITFSKKTPTTTEQTTFSQSPSTGEKVGTTGVRTTEMGPTTTRNTTVNYTNILVFLLSILIIIKSEKFSTILIPKEKEELTV